MAKLSKDFIKESKDKSQDDLIREIWGMCSASEQSMSAINKVLFGNGNPGLVADHNVVSKRLAVMEERMIAREKQENDQKQNRKWSKELLLSYTSLTVSLIVAVTTIIVAMTQGGCNLIQNNAIRKSISTIALSGDFVYADKKAEKLYKSGRITELEYKALLAMVGEVKKKTKEREKK